MKDSLILESFLAETNCFDADWYEQTYGDVKLLNMRPAYHYVNYGVLFDRLLKSEPMAVNDVEYDSRFLDSLSLVVASDLLVDKKKLLIRSVLSSCSDEAFLHSFFEVADFCFAHDYSFELYLRVVRFLKKGHGRGVKKEVFDLFLCLIMACEKDAAERRKSVFLLVLSVKKSGLRNVDFMLPVLLLVFEEQEANVLSLWVCDVLNCKHSKEVVSHLYKFPELMRLYNAKELFEVVEAVNTHNALLSAYVFCIKNQVPIPRGLLRKALSLKLKYKRYLLKDLRRFTHSLRKCNKLSADKEIEGLLSFDEDFLLLEYLGVAGREQFLTKSKFESVQKKIFCELPVDFRSKSLSALINDRNVAEGLVPLRLILGKGVADLFRDINKIVLDTPKVVLEQGKVLIVMTTHNPNLEMLELSLQSVQNQDYKNFQMVVVDDASINGNEIEKLVKKFSNFAYLRSEENIGAYACRNKAINQWQSKYVAFQDDDDVSHPQRISYQLKKLVSEGGLVNAVSHIRFDLDGLPQLDDGESIISDGPVTMLIDREVFNKIGCFKEYMSRGDVEFRSRCKKILGEQSYVQYNVPLYYAFGNENSLSTRFEKSNYFGHILQRKLIECREVLQ